MEPFIRVAFWTLTLFCCLQANPLRSHLSLKEANIDPMRTYSKCLSESTFYTPTNVKDKCIVKALECVRDELEGPAVDECDDECDECDCSDFNDEIQSAVQYLSHYLKDQTPDNSSECDCHNWPEKGFSEFLDSMKVLLEKDNYIHSSK